MRRFTVLVALVAAVALTGPAPTARAHANLVGSDPPANGVVGRLPPEVILWFTETPELRFSEVQIIGPDGQRADNGDLHVHGGDPRVRGIDARPGDPRVLGITTRADLPGGTYAVIWKVLSSVDGHVTQGLYAFSVGSPSVTGPLAAATLPSRPSGPPQWLSVLSRWVTFSGLMLTLGFATFPLLVAGPACRKAGLPPAPARTGVGLAGVTVATLVVGVALALLLQAWAAAGDLAGAFGSPLRDVLTASRFGDIWIVRAVLTGLTIEGFLLARPWGAQATSNGRSYLKWLPLAFGAVGLPLTVSLNSHAAAGDHARFATAIDWVHLVAAGMWTGGLAVFVVFVLDARKRGTSERARLLAAAVPRFSALAVVAVAALAGSGAYQWWRQLGDPGETLASLYGRLFLTKMALVAPLLALGAYNLAFVRPRLAAVLRGAVEPAGRAVRALGRSVPLEAALAIGVLAVTAALSNTSPPVDGISPVGAVQTDGLLQSQIVDDLTLTLSIDPGTAGWNRMDFYLQDHDGDERPVQRFIVRLTYRDQRLGTTEDDARQVHPTHFVLEGSQLALPGRWWMEVVVRREGLADARATFDLKVKPP